MAEITIFELKIYEAMNQLEYIEKMFMQLQVQFKIQEKTNKLDKIQEKSDLCLLWMSNAHWAHSWLTYWTQDKKALIKMKSTQINQIKVMLSNEKSRYRSITAHCQANAQWMNEWTTTQKKNHTVII